MGDAAETTEASRRPPLVPTSTLMTAAVSALGALLLFMLSSGFRKVNEPLHSSVETLGGTVAIGMAALLLVRWRQQDAPAHLEWSGTSLLVMGLLDIAHACTGQTPAFFWSRALPTVIGGGVMSLVWSKPTTRPRALVWLRPPLLLGVLTLPLCLALVLLPAHWPEAVGAEGDYHWWAKALNMTGALGFVAATAFFVRRFRTTRSRGEDLVFANQCVLLAVASALFGLSSLWDAVWWYFHALRLIAFLVVLRYVVELFQHAQELRHARREAEFERRLVGIVSHDLRNPLGVVQIAAQQLQRFDQPPQTAKGLERIVTAAGRMNRMIADLLAYSRARFHGMLPVSPEELDLREVCDAVRAEYDASHPGRIVVHHAAGALRGRWDRDRLHQLLANLVDNALKHGRGEAPITIETRDEGAGVVVQVHNEGAPIPADRLSQLFEPFRTSAGGRGGTGLGLYIVREIARAHGGDVSIESSEKAGTTVVARLPRQAAMQAPDPG